MLGYYGRARAAADQAIDELELESTGTAWFGDAVTMRWVLIHMVEETARHAGHVDILRELIDGMTGDHRPRLRSGQRRAAPAPAGWRRASGVGVRAWPRGRRRSAMPSRNRWTTNSTVEPIRNRMLGRYGLPGSR